MNSTHGNMASLTRGSVLGVLFGWGQETHTREHTREYWYTKHTHTHTHWISKARARWCSDEYSMYHTGMQQPNEETYPGPLLVNIDRPYPHRE